MLLENNPYPQDVRVRAEAEALVAAGHEVTVHAPRAAGQVRHERLAGVSVRRFALPESGGGLGGFLLEYAIAHAQLLARGLRELARGADVVHLHNPPDTLFPVSMAARAAGRAAVYDHHDLVPELFAEKFGASSLGPVLRAAQRAAFRSATATIVTNESQREIALERGGIGAGRVTVVRNGPARATLAADVDVRPGALKEPRIVFVGELEVQDGVLELPDLLTRPALRGGTLTIVGPGSLADPLRARAESLGVADRVRLTGRVPHERVPGLISEADICVDPAPCGDMNHRSTMIKITEYLAAARPVVAYELLETRRTAGEAVLYAPCGDGEAFGGLVERLAGEPAERERLATAGRARAEELVWEHSARALTELYARLAAQPCR